MKPVAHTRPQRPRAARCAAVALAALILAATAQPAAAYEPFTLGGTCTNLTWTSQPRVVVHTGELPTGPSGFGDNLFMLAAVNEINDEFNRVAATTAEITSTTTSTDPFTQGVWFNDPVPTIHVGFHNNSSPLGSGAPGPTTSCQYDEAHIGFKNLDLAQWEYGVPQDGGQEYYEATMDDEDGERYFRLAYLHELLHTFGLNHSDSSYSIVNYGDRPWSDANTIRPLPDDVKGLRELYPEPNVGNSEVAVYNSWYTQVGAVNGAAQQEYYCKPTLGDMFVFDMFAANCGVIGPDAGSTQVCTGSDLHAGFTVANYSTETAHVTARLWLSLDDRWDLSDTVSPTRHGYDLGVTDSDPQTDTWEIPNLGFPDAEYHLIVRVKGTTANGRSVDAWTPLGAQVQFDFQQCLTAAPSSPVLTGPIHA